MIKKILPIVILLVWTTGLQAQFNFHWAFPYYAYQNLDIRNGNANILVLTSHADFNGFKNVENKKWGDNHKFAYAKLASEVSNKSYIFLCTDETTTKQGILRLHELLPKTVIFFIHRNKTQWPNDLDDLKKVLTERPGWAYGGNPYDAETPIVRSNKSMFISKNIVLGSHAPGEGINETTKEK